MITADQLKDIQERTEALHRYLDIDKKRIEFEEEQLRTQAPDFWDDPARAQEQMKKVKKLGIPVLGIVDTNSDPDLVDYVVPGNDDAVKSVSLLLGVLNNAVLEVKGLETTDYLSEDDKEKTVKEEVVEVKEEKKEENNKKEEIVEVVEAEEEVVLTQEELEEKTLPELKEIARLKKLTGFSTMKKKEIIDLIINN